MRTSRFLLISALTLSSIATAQTQLTAQAPPAQQPANSGVTLHAGTQLVIVDVVVTDKDHNPVHGLKASDFTLLEKNVPQQIKNFEEHTALPPAELAKLPPFPKMPPGIFTNYSPPVNGPLNVLLLDTLNTPLRDQAYVHEELRKYINSAPPGTRIAIFGLTTRLILLQGFTSDPELLKAAINQKNLKASPLLDDEVGGDGMSDVIGNLQQFEVQIQSLQTQLRFQYTLDGLNQLARGLSGLPGRKNLIWFSASFPINILPEGDIQNPFALVPGAEEEFRETTDLLTASQVAVYPVDARGLVTAPMSNAAATSRNPAVLVTEQQNFFGKTANEHFTMLSMAEETGGRAFIDTNDLTHAVAQSIETGSNYYTLYYAPTDTNWNGGFRKIQVKLEQQGLTLSYRRGYYADNPNAPKKGKAVVSTTSPALAPIDAMHFAMMRGGPDPTQILFKVRVLPASTATEDNIAQNNALNPKLNIKGPYRRFIVDYAVAPSDILFSQSASGVNQGKIRFLIYLYNQEGELINLTDNYIQANLTAAGDFLKHGIPYHQEISVPIKGQYYLRIGVHDIVGNRVGAVEIPVANLRNLSPPVPTAPSAVTPIAPK